MQATKETGLRLYQPPCLELIRLKRGCHLLLNLSIYEAEVEDYVEEEY